MPANTPAGLPYPLPTEPVKDGAVSIQNLATALDGRGQGLYSIRGQNSSWNVPAGGLYSFTFPYKFTGNPVVCKFVGKVNGQYAPLLVVNAGYPYSYMCQVQCFSVLKVSPFTVAAWTGQLYVDYEITGPGPITTYP